MNNNSKTKKNKDSLKDTDNINDDNIQNNNKIKDDSNKENNANNMNKEEKGKEVVINIDSNEDSEELSQSIKNLLLDKEFASPVIVKKENKLITNYHYATFKNGYGENACYINVILHLLYNIEELRDFLYSLFQIDESNKPNEKDEKKNKDKDKDQNDNEDCKIDNNEFLTSLGKIISRYKYIISNEEKNKNNQVTVINTLKMRKILEKLSGNKFQLNTIADPVELFTFILDILSKNLDGDTHKTFYLDLIDEYTCEQNGCNQIKNKYDKDNFIYHIYIDEILKYLSIEDIKVKDYNNKLFEYSYTSFLQSNIKICEKCNSLMEHDLICNNCPDYILINCVWRESNPKLEDVMTILFLLSLKDDLNNLFDLQIKKKQNSFYCLFGFILYSFTLSHYIICQFNEEKKVFVLLDDEVVKEFNNLYDLIIEISAEVLKKNGKAFFYPVMLIYQKRNIYYSQFLKNNKLNDKKYEEIINKCQDAINEYQSKEVLTEEFKSDNYQKLIEEQKVIENQIRRSRKKAKENSKDKKKSNEGEEEKEKINDIKNGENIIRIEDEDNKSMKDDKEQNQGTIIRNKYKEKNKNLNSDTKNNDNNQRNKSKSRKKEEKEETKIEIEKEKEKNNSKNKNNKNTKVKKKRKEDINQIIWNQSDRIKKEEQNKENEDKAYKNTRKSVEMKNNTYLGKKINNPIGQNNINDKENKRKSQYKGDNLRKSYNSRKYK